jgi:hypothetical protein
MGEAFWALRKYLGVRMSYSNVWGSECIRRLEAPLPLSSVIPVMFARMIEFPVSYITRPCASEFICHSSSETSLPQGSKIR